MHERLLARSLAELELKATTSSSNLGTVSWIEWRMEWFLTWRLKLGHYPYTMWCDGVKDLRITAQGKRSYNIEAKAWIGPEADTKDLNLCDLRGTIMLNQKQDELRSYQLHITDGEREYVARKAI